MRATQAVGRPGTPVIPGQWSQAPRTGFAKTRTARITIRRPGAVKGAFDDTTGTYPMVPPEPHFTGTARIQARDAQPAELLVADQEVTTTGYLVAVPLDATQVQVEDIVTVTDLDCNGDEVLVGHELIVRSVATGSLVWERDLICTDDQG